mgnify:CR=1 FL=1
MHTLSLIGLVGGLALLIVLTMRGMNLFIATPLCALLVALTGGIALLPPLAAEGAPDLLTLYMGGFSGFIAKWFAIFLLGAIFGKLMESAGAADSVARGVTRLLGPQRAALAVVAACVILTYGGVSLFVVAFSVYPMAVSLFRQADLPRRFIPAALAFGSVTFTMTSAGSPEIQNWIPIEYLHTSPLAGWQASAVCAVFMAILGSWWMRYMLRAATARGERFEPRPDDPDATREDLPHPLLAAVPLLVVLAIAFLLHEKFKTSALVLALLGGSIAAALLNFHHLRELRRQSQDVGKALSAGSLGALVAVGNTAAVVGFGACMVGFGLSQLFWLSAFFLLLSGVFDGVSVVLRSTILQLSTPDDMRGRVSSVNSIFISSSNELGAFYSGAMARLLGLVPSVVLGGFVTMGVVAATAWRAPKLRQLDLRDIQ